MEYKYSNIFTWSSGKPVELNDGSIPVYGSNGIIGYSDKAKYNNKIILGRVGAYCGSVEYCPDDFNATDNTLITTCNEEYIDYKYAFYMLKVAELNKYAGGSAQPLITQSILKHLKCDIPDLEIQNKIASVLSTYDDLIEKNNRKIEILQDMAEELYKEWFVRFRFPGYKTAKFTDGIPDGWERKKIKEYYDTCSGGTPNRSNELYYLNGTYKWIKTGEIKDTIIVDTEEYITEQALNSSSAKLLPANAVIMAMYGVNIGMLGYIDGEMTCNQACCVFSDKRDFSSKHYLFYYLKSIREYLLLISFGAAQQNLSQELIKKIKILMPSDNVVKAFENKIEPIYQNIRNLILSNNNLKQQRDLLLPRLMSGKLEVKVS